MKTPILVLAGIALFLGVAAMPLAAQSLLDNQYYHKAQDLLTQSQKALDDGDYDGSAALAAQAQDNFAKSDDYVATMTQFYRANGYLSIAKDRVAYAKSIDADVNYKSAYTKAVTAVAGAKTALDGKDYPKSIDLSKSAIAALANIAPVAKVPPKEPPEAGAAGRLLSRSTTRSSFGSLAETASGGSPSFPSSTTTHGSGGSCTPRTRISWGIQRTPTSSSRA